MKTIGKIIRWALSIIMLLVFLGLLSMSISASLFALASCLIINPLITSKFNLKKKIYISLWIILFIVTFALTPTNNTKSLESSNEVKSESTQEKSKSVKQTGSKDTVKPSNVSTPTPTITETPTQTPKPSGDMAVHFLDVGQGLSILVQSGGQNLIYDGGDRSTSSFVVSYLKQQGIENIDYMIASHYDEDHVSGLIGCLNAFDVKNVICPDYIHDSQTYESFTSAVKNEQCNVINPNVGDIVEFGTGSFTVLAPNVVKAGESNNNSVAISLHNGDNSFVFTGDAEHESESSMCNSGIDLSCDVLVLGHHGSASATSSLFLSKTIPEFAVISCGTDNQYGHPDKDVMDLLQSMEAQVYRTDKQGTIIAISNGTDISWNQSPCNDYSAGDVTDRGTQPQINQSSGTTNSNGQDGGNFTQQDDNVTSAPSGGMVWISETGSKYHNKPDCGRMNPDKATQMEKSKAESLGYDACSKCF